MGILNTVPKFPVESRVIHLKSGNVYEILHDPSTTLLEATAEPAYVYCTIDGSEVIWIRCQYEMEDGRFERIS